MTAASGSPPPRAAPCRPSDCSSSPHRRHHRAVAVLCARRRRPRHHRQDHRRAVPRLRRHPGRLHPGHPRRQRIPVRGRHRLLRAHPLLLGLYAAGQAWRKRDDDDDDDDKTAGKTISVWTISVWTVAAVTFANGGDNIGVYVPVFLTVGTAAIVAYTVVFLALVSVLVLAARYIATRRPIAEVPERRDTSCSRSSASARASSSSSKAAHSDCRRTPSPSTRLQQSLPAAGLP